MTKKTTFVSFLLDETGSMQNIKDDTIGGFNSYVEVLQKSDDDIVFSLVSFNSGRTRRRYVAESIRDIVPLTENDYVPDMMTPLIDAAVKIIRATDEAVRDRGDDPNVVVVMQTDGRENVSVEYTNIDLAALIKEKAASGWQFVFLGAGLDAFHAARQAGIDFDPDKVVSYSRARSHKVFELTARNITKFAQYGDAQLLDYSPEQREKVDDKHTWKYLGEDAKSGRKASSQSGRKSRRAASTSEDYKLTRS
ncbi:MAG: hypothetical protein CME26_16055 [Gemmatimonadetes bacterium]|nr:hypothetical protein [Gemmatimonadota bacterium]